MERENWFETRFETFFRSHDGTLRSFVGNFVSELLERKDRSLPCRSSLVPEIEKHVNWVCAKIGMPKGIFVSLGACENWFCPSLGACENRFCPSLGADFYSFTRSTIEGLTRRRTSTWDTQFALELLNVILAVEKNDIFDNLQPYAELCGLCRYLLESVDADASRPDSALAIASTSRAFLAFVLHLLTSVFQYLIGYVDRGGAKTFSAGAFDFRASFVALVLFQGAYVWIKFRQADRPGGRKRKTPAAHHDGVDIETCHPKGLVYIRDIKDKSSGALLRHKYEPRFTPPRLEVDDGSGTRPKRLPLGEYHTHAEAQIVLEIARYCYSNENGGCVELEGGQYKFPIPPMSEQKWGLAGEEKRTWAKRAAKQVGKQMYAAFVKEKANRLDLATEARSRGAEINGPSSSSWPLTCGSPTLLAATTDEPAIASGAPSPPSRPSDGAIGGDAYDRPSEDLAGFEDMLAALAPSPDLSNLSVGQSDLASYGVHYQEFAQLLGNPSLPDGAAAPGGMEPDVEPEWDPSAGNSQPGRALAGAGPENPGGSIFLQPSVSDLQQLVLYLMKALEDKDRCIEDMNRRLEDKDRLIEDMNRKALEDKDRRIEDMNRRLEGVEACQIQLQQENGRLHAAKSQVGASGQISSGHLVWNRI